jgi:toxin-antitoxin system PIN domain toxin
VTSAALLDVNVLVALFDPDHVHHLIAHDWFADHGGQPWATCGVTEAGFMRVVANPAYGSPIESTADLIPLLRKFCSSRQHQFWAETVSFRDDDLFRASFVRGYRQLTDLYLLGLATKKRGRLVTFDSTIPLEAVVGATPGNLHVIAAAAEGASAT